MVSIFHLSRNDPLHSFCNEVDHYIPDNDQYIVHIGHLVKDGILVSIQYRSSCLQYMFHM